MKMPIGKVVKNPARNLLVVDDDIAMTALLKDFLARQGYEVTVTSSVAGALALFRSAPPDKPFDLVISDVKLGKANGFDLTRVVNLEQPNLPVILFSVSEDLEKAALESGARKFLSKPFSLFSLSKLVEEDRRKK